MKGELAKESAIATNHILNIASAVKINKEIIPRLFSQDRLGLVALNTFTFGCVRKQLNYRRVKN